MSRAMYGTGDALANAGHQVDYLFNEHFRSQVPEKLRRFTVPFRIATLICLRHRKHPYDVVEIHEPLAATYCIQRRYKKNMPPLTVFSHGLEERGWKAELEYRKQKGLQVSVKQRYSPLSVILQARYAVRHCDQVVCTNLADLAYLSEANVPETRLSLVHNGIDEDLLAAGKSSQEETVKRDGLLFVGSWLVRKGVLDIVPAVSTVLNKYRGLTFTVAGSGLDEESVKREFPESVRQQITVIPRFSGNKTLISLYQNNSILILPSYFEGQPLVMIEAAAFGMAIVTTNVCGMIDFVEDGINGLLINPGDDQALTTRLAELINNQERVHQIGKKARATAEQHTWTESARHLLRAYERAICVAQVEAH